MITMPLLRPVVPELCWINADPRKARSGKRGASPVRGVFSAKCTGTQRSGIEVRMDAKFSPHVTSTLGRTLENNAWCAFQYSSGLLGRQERKKRWKGADEHCAQERSKQIGTVPQHDENHVAVAGTAIEIDGRISLRGIHKPTVGDLLGGITAQDAAEEPLWIFLREPSHARTNI